MGWGYSDWNGAFYPKGLPAREQLGHYSQVLNSVEIDSTHYACPSKGIVENWRNSVPDDFVFTAKVPRSITHEMQLAPPSDKALEAFVETISVLGNKLGALLLQFPAEFTRAQLPEVREFLPILSQIAPHMRFAIEFRHRSLLSEDIREMLQEYRIAQVAADYAGLPRKFQVTSDFVYMRLLGKHGSYTDHTRRQGDRTDDLQKWTNHLTVSLPNIEHAFVYCNNDYEGFSPNSCHRIKNLLNIPSVEKPRPVQPSLF